ncbi:ECF-type sigma factor [Luteimonas aquatica]|uniref:ECF-type sigma factor n=1 Tax=Luteimonas aquatica TaxID=450364 RepID=UPI001F596BFC|nr:ECF-type sigma factor [Luteimonas aquatica]
MHAGRESPSQDITQLFVSWRHGNGADFDALFAALYQELRAIAHQQLARARASDTLRTTAFVHEAYLRLADGKRLDVNDRGHFLALCARVMRNVLVDRSRERGRQKRGGDLQRVELDEEPVGDAPGAADVLAVDAALERLARLDARQVEIAQMRVFGGLTLEEAAQALGVSAATVKRDWRKARMFLVRELNLEPGA